MNYLAVTREHGPAWDRSRQMREQDKWSEHAAFMEALVDDGFIVLGGPIGDGTRTLLIVDALDRGAVDARFADDPWTELGLLRVANVERWEVLLGADGTAPLGG